MACHQRTVFLRKEFPKLSLLLLTTDKHVHVALVSGTSLQNWHKQRTMSFSCPNLMEKLWHQIHISSIPRTRRQGKRAKISWLLNSLKTVKNTISPHRGLPTGPLPFHQFIPLVFAVVLCGRTLAMAPRQKPGNNSPSIPVFRHKLRELPGNRDSTDLPSRCT